MIKSTKEKQELTTRIREAFYQLEINSMINCYALENIVLGRIKPQEQIPSQQYAEDLKFSADISRLLAGFVLDEHGIVKSKSLDEFLFEFYTDKMELLFLNAPRAPDGVYENDILPFKNGLHEYLYDTYYLFKEIMQEQVCYDPFALMGEYENETVRKCDCALWADFVTAVKLKGLNQGRRVDRYLKNCTRFPYGAELIVKIHKGHYLLTNSNTNSTNYRLALFSAIPFCTEENAKLFALKLKTWYQSNQ